ncbi:MAG: hypothetical protein MH825_15825 [Cyanobacteria bacterium]|nr:hypothetical protein [Cyanobacteriota bacterium]
MNEFRGIVRLDQPFLEQPEVAEFLQSSPEDSFPRSALDRLLSVAEWSLQTQAIARNSVIKLARLRLNCNFLKPSKEINCESKVLKIHSIEWTSELSYDQAFSAENSALSQFPEFAEITSNLNSLANRIYEVLKPQVGFHEEPDIDISISLEAMLALPRVSSNERSVPRTYPLFGRIWHALIGRPALAAEGDDIAYLLHTVSSNLIDHQINECAEFSGGRYVFTTVNGKKEPDYQRPCSIHR